MKLTAFEHLAVLVAAAGLGAKLATLISLGPVPVWAAGLVVGLAGFGVSFVKRRGWVTTS